MDDDKFYWMDIDEHHLGDLLHDIATMFQPYSTVLGDPPINSRGLVGIVSEDDGGIVAYAIGEEHANMIVKALNA